MKNDAYPLAIASIFLYSSVALVSGYYYLKFDRNKALRIKNRAMPNHFERYESPKKFFFLVLMISATLDIPMYIGCAAKGGPHDCEWDDISYPVVWCMHLLALIGYAFSIVIPPVLWSDIVNQKDGKLWRSEFPVDFTKRFFQIALASYSVLMTMTVLLVICFFDVKHHTQFAKGNVLNAISTCLEPVLTFFLAAGCLWCGVRLQMYVMRVRLDATATIKFLIRLNVTMLIIAATYCMRSLLVLRLFVLMPRSYERALACSYPVWILCTRWLPYVVCSFCLMNEMKLSGQQIARRLTRRVANSSDYLSLLEEKTEVEEGSEDGKASLLRCPPSNFDRGGARDSLRSNVPFSRTNTHQSSSTAVTINRGHFNTSSNDDKISLLSQSFLSDEQTISSEHYYDTHHIHPDTATIQTSSTAFSDEYISQNPAGHMMRMHSTESVGFVDCFVPPSYEPTSPQQTSPSMTSSNISTLRR